jgi:hypothetical protein
MAAASDGTQSGGGDGGSMVSYDIEAAMTVDET